MRKPKGLKKGDKVAIVSLSSGLLGDDFAKHEILLGSKRLEEFGLVPVFMPNALKGTEFVKKHPEERARDLKEAFKDPSIKGIICAIGGDDTYRLLPYLLEDEGFIDSVRENPKLFTGYSDTTINHLMFHNLGMVTYYGPNFVCDLAEFGAGMLPYTKKSFEAYFEGAEYKTITASDTWYEERTDFSCNSVGTERIAHKETRGYEILQGGGRFSGELLGGCLESLYDILAGERYADEPEVCETYALFPKKEHWKGKILFVETCEEKPEPVVMEKELLMLKKTGIFDVVRGVLVGKPQDEAFYEEYKAVYRRVFDNKNLPVVYNVNFGHAHPKCVLPVGLAVEVDCEKREITLLEGLFE